MVNSEYYMVKDNGPRGGSNIHEGIYIAGRIIIISLHIESIIKYIANQLCREKQKASLEILFADEQAIPASHEKASWCHS